MRSIATRSHQKTTPNILYPDFVSLQLSCKNEITQQLELFCFGTKPLIDAGMLCATVTAMMRFTLSVYLFNFYLAIIVVRAAVMHCESTIYP
tara:strand:+ start:156 stop:431 length:276 start_codon:yes stop_codon:yes gene_type:complete